MRFFINKGILKKALITLFLILMLFQLVLIKPVHAFDGGILLQPIMTLFVSIGDAVMSVVEDVLMQTQR